MLSTPAKPIDNVKTSGGIRKTLLTPCRRVGLSRVVKTPASTEKTAKNTESPLACKTPVNSAIVSCKDNVKEEKVTAGTHENKANVRSAKVSKKSVKKCLLLSAQADGEVAVSPKCIAESPHTKTREKKNGRLDRRKSKQKCESRMEQTQTTTKKQLPPDNDEQLAKFEETTISPEVFSDSPQEEKENIKEQKDKVKKEVSPSFKGFTSQSETKNNCMQDDNKTDTSDCNELKVVLTSLCDIEDDDFQPNAKFKKRRLLSSSSEGSVNSVSKNGAALKDAGAKAKSSFKKRLSMKKSKCGDDESFHEASPSPLNSQKSQASCFTDLTELPLLCEATETSNKLKSRSNESSFCYEINEEMLENIKSSIKEKEDKLDRLKRAEVYSKMHKVGELNELTLKWKSGCIQALNDLLVLLQKNGEIDMVALLQMLKVPEHMIKLNVESGDLV